MVVHSGYVRPLHSDWGGSLPFRVSVSVGVPRNHRTRIPDNPGRSHDHSLIGAADRSFAFRRNDSFAMITNHSRHGPLVVSQLRFSGPVPLNAVAPMGQPTQLPLWDSLLMRASRASSLCSISFWSFGTGTRAYSSRARFVFFSSSGKITPFR